MSGPNRRCSTTLEQSPRAVVEQGFEIWRARYLKNDFVGINQARIKPRARPAGTQAEETMWAADERAAAASRPLRRASRPPAEDGTSRHAAPTQWLATSSWSRHLLQLLRLSLKRRVCVVHSMMPL